MKAKRRITFVLFVAFILSLAACTNDNEAHGSTNESKTEETEPSTDGNKENIADNTTKDSNEEKSDDASHEENTQSNDVKEIPYDSVQEAVAALEDYHKIEQTNTDLGHGIEGLVEGAAGHSYISWNEGNWLIEIDSPTNPEYATNNYKDGLAIAKAVVSYLEDHYLPAPDERGVIKINSFAEHPETTIRWQVGKTVYEIDEDTTEPMKALEIAVEEA